MGCPLIRVCSLIMSNTVYIIYGHTAGKKMHENKRIGKFYKLTVELDGTLDVGLTMKVIDCEDRASKIWLRASVPIKATCIE